MNAVMRIQVRVVNGATPEIKAIQAALTQLARTAAAANAQIVASTAAARTAQAGMTGATMAGVAAQTKFGNALRMSPLEKYGKNLQWTGRQIEYNFTLPLLLAGGAATKWALETEAAMVRVTKVYGSTYDMADGLRKQNAGLSQDMAEQQATAIFENELKSLEKAFTALSNAYGVNRAEVLGIAGDWSAAGASGYALARQVRQTMDTMILGELDAKTATEALIAIQAQYNQTAGNSVEMLKKVNSGLKLTDKDMNTLAGTMAYINMIENESGAQFGDLTIAFSRAAGQARTAGVTIRQLGAHVAALRPAAGTAAQVGNGLKSMYASIMSPSGDAREVLGLMGIAVNDLGWQSRTAAERIELMADKFVTLDKAQQSVVASTVFNKWQVSKAGVLFRDIASGVGNYDKALRATAVPNRVMLQYQKELTAVLSSNPRKVQILTTMIKNLMADAIIPLIPAIVGVLDRIRRLMEGFSNLSPAMQQIILGSLVLLAVFGTLTRITGAFILLFTRFGAMIAWVAHLFHFVATGGAAAAVGTAAQGAAAAGAAPGNARNAASLGILRTALAMVAVHAWVAAASLGSAMAFMGRVILSPLRAMVWVTGQFAWMWTMRTLIMQVALLRMTAMQTAFNARWVALNNFILATWVGMHTRLLAIQAAASTALATGWARLGVFYTTMTSGMATRIVALWWAMGARVLAAQLWMHGAALPAIRTFFVYMFTNTSAFLQVLSNMYWAAVTQVLRAWGAMMMGMTRLQVGLLPMLARWRTFWALKIATAWGGVRGVLGAMATMMRSGLRMLMSGAFWVRIWTVTWGFMVATARGGVTALARIMMRAIPLLFGPWGIAAMAAVGVIYMFRDHIAKALNHIIEKWYQMPTGIMGALKAIVSVIAAGVKAAYEWLSYLNPFQRHSPSLVDNVIRGVDIIAKRYASLKNIGHGFRAAIHDLNAFGKATAALKNREGEREYQEDRAVVVKQGGKGAGVAMDKMRASIASLRPMLAAVGAEYVKQSRVVDDWAGKLSNAENATRRESAALDVLRNKATALSDQLEAAKDKLASYANAPLKGMGAMNDKIFANEMAQKKLRLEMLKMKQAGKSADDVRDRMSRLRGEIEGMRSERNDLRLAGAGSDVLGVIDAQIAAAEKAYSGMSMDLGPMEQAQKDLDNLALEGEILELEKAINFDPLLYAIEKALDLTQEMSFDEIMAGIKATQAEVATLEAAWKAADAAAAAQQAVVDKMQAQEDAIRARYDLEKQKLEELGFAYEAIEQQIKDMEDAMKDFVSVAASAQQAQDAADKVKKDEIDKVRTPKEPKPPKPSPSAQNFMDAAGGNWEDPGGEGLIGRDSFMDESANIDKFTKDLEEQLKGGFGSFDIFGPFKKKWSELVAWIDSWSGGFATALGDGLKKNTSRALAGAGIGAGIGMMIAGPAGAVIGTIIGGIIGAFVSKEMLADLGGAIVDVFTWMGQKLEPVGKVIGKVWDGFLAGLKILGELFGPQVREIWTQFTQFFDQLKGVLYEKFTKPLQEMGPQFQQIWNALVTGFQWVKGHLDEFFKVLAVLFGIALQPIILAWSIAFSVVKNVAVVVFDFLLAMIGAGLDILMGIIKVFVSLFTGDWQGMWDGIKKIASGGWDAIVAVFKGIGGIIWGVVKGVVEGIVDWFKWLYDVLVGHSIVPDLMNKILEWFQWLIGPVKAALKAVWDGIEWVFENVAKPVFGLMVDGIKAWASIFVWIWDHIIKPAFAAIWAGIQWSWDNVAKPVFKFLWDAIVTWAGIIGWIWDNVIKAAFKALWDGVKWSWENVAKPVFEHLWNGIKVWAGIIGWVWTNVISPAFTALWNGVKGLWTNVAVPIFNFLWEGIKTWAGIIGWVWTNVISPAFTALWNGVKAVWTRVAVPVFEFLWEGIKTWAGIIGWIWTNVISPAFTSLWGGIKTMWERVGKPIFSTIASAIVSIINTAIDAVNAITGGISKVASVVKLSFDIPKIDKLNPPKFAKGGVLPGTEVGAGFVTNQPRAIVGEGGRHPEYVIPTDPRHRDRAQRLYAMLGKDIGGPIDAVRGVAGSAASGVGNAASAVGGAVSGAAGAVAGAVRGAAAKAFEGALGFANGFINKLPEGWVRGIATGLRDRVVSWVKGEDQKLPALGEVGNGAVPGQGWQAIAKFMHTTGVPWVPTSTYRAGDDGYHGQGRALDMQGPGGPAAHRNRGYGDPGMRAIFNALMPIAGNLKEVILAGAPFNIKNGKQVPGYAWGEPGSPGNHWNHVHAALAEGGIVRRPMKALIGEAGPEAVMPLGPLMDNFAAITSAINQLNLDSALRAARWESAWSSATNTHAKVLDERLVANHTALRAAMEVSHNALIQHSLAQQTADHAFFSGLNEALMTFLEEADTARTEATTANHTALMELLTANHTALMEHNTQHLDLVRENHSGLVEALASGFSGVSETIASAITAIGGMIDRVREAADKAQNTADEAKAAAAEAMAAANAAGAAASAAASAAAANAQAIKDAADKAKDAPAAGSLPYGNGTNPGQGVPINGVTPRGPSGVSTAGYESTLGTTPIPNRTSMNDWVVQNTPYSELTARQLAYADINGLTLAMASGGIATRATRAIVGEAGAEAVLPLASFYRRMDENFGSIRDVLRTGIPVTSLPTGDVSMLAASASRRVASGGDTMTPTATTETHTVNINGDLSFPNITDGQDAEAFIRNLENLAG